MKKLFALLMVCGFAFAFVACGGKKAESTVDSTAVAAPDTTAVAPDTTKTDTAAVK